MNFSLVFKLYFSSTFNYLQLNYIRTPFRLPSWCHALLQERIQTSSPKAVEKSLCDFGRARPKKDVVPFSQEENGGRVQKNDEKK